MVISVKIQERLKMRGSKGLGLLTGITAHGTVFYTTSIA